MGNLDSLVSELQRKLGELAPLLIEASALRARDLMIESMASAAGGVAPPSEKATSQRKGKKKRAYTRIDDGAIMKLLRETGPMRLTDVHEVIGGSISNLSKKVALLKSSGMVQDVVIGKEKRIKAARDGRNRVTALPGEKAAGKKAASSKVAKTSEKKAPKSRRASTLLPAESIVADKPSGAAANDAA